MHIPSVKEVVSAEEWQLRCDLAACYRLVAAYGWSDLVFTHISARVPGDDHSFLINPYGLMFDEITASSLVLIDQEGNKRGESPFPVNRAGFVIHSAIHAARHDAQCVMHLHTPDGIAVSMLEEGLLPLNQTAMLSAGGVAFHEFEGIAVDLDERERLAADLGDKNLMLLRNHGTLALGGTVAEAFTAMYFLETACTIQVRALGMNRPLHPVGDEAINKVAQFRNGVGPGGGTAGVARDLVWPAMLRKLDRLDPTWRG